MHFVTQVERYQVVSRRVPVRRLRAWNLGTVSESRGLSWLYWASESRSFTQLSVGSDTCALFLPEFSVSIGVFLSTKRAHTTTCPLPKFKGTIKGTQRLKGLGLTFICHLAVG